ncbi:MAG: hypothetical protein COA79_06415 [Planctomycetota bacterium]|nr:MAG: hypothetical protein COA79_06415 [Planctomycetota bacterium]
MSREEILNRIKQSKTENNLSLPSLDIGITYDDSIIAFCESLKSVAGEMLEEADLENYIKALEHKYGAMKFLNTYVSKEINNPLIPIQMESPHDAKRLDILVIEGLNGIAENGAIWIEEPILYPRSAIFLTQHLIIFLKKTTILNNLHEFYQQANFHEKNYGTLISGPSKTADVEQCLVIGAHGSRSLAVVLID